MKYWLLIRIVLAEKANVVRIILILLLIIVSNSSALAQTLTTNEPPGQKMWEVLLKLAFPIILTALGPWVTGFIKTWPPPVKYAVAGLTSMFAGALVGEIPDFPLTPESAATIGLTSGIAGQGLFMMTPKAEGAKE